MEDGSIQRSSNRRRNDCELGTVPDSTRTISPSTVIGILIVFWKSEALRSDLNLLQLVQSIQKEYTNSPKAVVFSHDVFQWVKETGKDERARFIQRVVGNDDFLSVIIDGTMIVLTWIGSIPLPVHYTRQIPFDYSNAHSKMHVMEETNVVLDLIQITVILDSKARLAPFTWYPSYSLRPSSS